MAWWGYVIIAVYALGIGASWRFAAQRCLEDIEMMKPRSYQLASGDKARAVGYGLAWSIFWPPLLILMAIWTTFDMLGSTLTTERERQQQRDNAEHELTRLAAMNDLPLIDPSTIIDYRFQSPTRFTDPKDETHGAY